MSTQITLNSFAELAEAFQAAAPAARSDEPITDLPACMSDTEAPELGDLWAELRRASATLAAIAHNDEEDRKLALSSLEQYDALLQRLAQAEAVCKRARYVRRQAHELAKNAFRDTTREAAGRVIQLAERSEAQAVLAAQDKHTAIQELASSIEQDSGMKLDQLLAERRRLQEVERRRVAEVERAERLSAALAGARAALQAGRPEEARALLEPVAKEHPDDAEIASLSATIAQRALTVKTTAAQEAVWTTRAEYRRDPASALTRLEALDLDGLQAELVKEVFSVWFRACAQLCQERQLSDPLRCSAGFGRVFVAARERPDGPHLVVSALGLRGLCLVGTVPNPQLMVNGRPLF